MGKGVARIVIRIARMAAAIHTQHLVTQLRVGNMVLDNLLGHAGIQGVAVGLLIRNLAMQDVLVHKQAGDVRAALGHVVRVATGARVDFKKPVGAVARIVFNVEITKAAVANVLAKALGILDDALDALNDRLAQRMRTNGFTDSEIAAAKLSQFDLITVASLIEKETAKTSESATIASVIYNRLCSKLYPCLEIDATIQYALAERKEILSNADKGVLSPYNTYTNAGLPAGPIANPGMNSIRAALYPAETNYYFYALDTTGVHHFSETYYEHQNFLNELAGKEEEETQPDGAEQTEETADTENQTDG